jgi:hypothetical protein
MKIWIVLFVVTWCLSQAVHGDAAFVSEPLPTDDLQVRLDYVNRLLRLIDSVQDKLDLYPTTDTELAAEMQRTKARLEEQRAALDQAPWKRHVIHALRELFPDWNTTQLPVVVNDIIPPANKHTSTGTVTQDEQTNQKT